MKKISILDLFVVLIVALTLGCNNNNKCPSHESESKLVFSSSDSLKRSFGGAAESKKQLEQFLRDSTSNLFKGEILIINEKTLIEIAEPILFKGYGKENIISQRPYEIYLFGDYWIMSGTLPRVTIGGTFSIAINRRTCQVIGITHGK
ncbi:MAG TPA: NTF2 fold immunity protein [Bacteroidales bacterium]